MANQGGGQPVGENGRMRNTLANLLTKYNIDYTNPGGAQALPALTPAETSNYYAQLGGLYGQYQTTLAGLRNARYGVLAQRTQGLAQAKADTITGVARAFGDAADRGLVGSSIEGTNIAGAKAAGAQEAAAAKTAALQALGQIQVQKQQAGLGLYQGVTTLEGQALASREATLANQLQQNLIVSGQETQMDALAAIYQALAGQTPAGATRPRRGRSPSINQNPELMYSGAYTNPGSYTGA